MRRIFISLLLLFGATLWGAEVAEHGRHGARQLVAIHRTVAVYSPNDVLLGYIALNDSSILHLENTIWITADSASGGLGHLLSVDTDDIAYMHFPLNLLASEGMGIQIEVVDNDTLGGKFEFYHQSGDPADGDVIGDLNWMALDDILDDEIYGNIICEIQDPGATVEEAILRFNIVDDGTLTEYLRLDASNGVKANVTAVPVRLPNGTVSLPSIAFVDAGGNWDSGIYRPAVNTIGFGVGGVLAGWVDATGFIVNDPNGPGMWEQGVTDVVPGFSPNRSDANSGVGWANADQISQTAGGVEVVRHSEGGGKVSSVFGGSVVETITDATSAAAAATLTKAGENFEVTCSIGDVVLIYGGGTEADFGTYIIVDTAATILTLDRVLSVTETNVDFDVIADGVVIENSTTTGIATIRPSLINVLNDTWMTATGNDGSTPVNMFKVNTSDEIDAGAQLNVGLISFIQDAGMVTAMDMPVSNASADDLEMSYVFKLDGTNVLKIYGESDGAGGADELRVVIANTIPPDVILDNTTTGADANSGHLILRGNDGAADTELQMSAMLEVNTTTDYYWAWYNDDKGTEVGSIDQGGNLQVDGTFGMGGGLTITMDDPFVYFDPATASESEWWIGTNNDAGGDDNDNWEIRQSATPGTNVELYVQPDGDAFVTGDLTITGDDLFMGTNTTGFILRADGTNYNPVAFTQSSDLAGFLSNETGTGLVVFGTAPTLVTPALGAATATSINGLTITATGNTFNLAQGTGSLDVAAAKTVNIDQDLSVTTEAITLNQSLQTTDEVDFAEFGNTAQQTITLGNGAVTFAVTSNVVTVTGDGGGNTIGTITGAHVGVYTFIFVDALVTITDTDAATVNATDLVGTAANFASADDSVLQLVYDGTSWFQTSASVN